jgi:hypothetical protein
MRREFIHPHRSVRSFPISRTRFFAALGMAAVVSSAAAYFGSTLLVVHSQLSSFVLRCTRIPINGVQTLEIFPHLGPVVAPQITFHNSRADPLRTGLLFAVSVTGLVLIHRRVPLSRNFVVFLIVLLCTAGAVIIFNPSFYFDCAMFEQIWLRGEILVWILLPWISVFLFILTVPSVAGGAVWALLLQIYAMLWSALRLAFCLGVLHYTGILYLPFLWFCLGILFDLVYVLVFYSLVLHLSIKHVTGERR